jgi:diguanylate cyclase (GGDEF)-like protein
LQGIKPQSSAINLDEQFYLHDDLSQTRIIIMISSFFVSLLVYGDYLNFGFSSEFYTIVFARVIFLVISLITLYLLNHVKTAQQYEYLSFLWTLFLILLAIYANISRPVTNIRFSNIDPLIILAIFVFFPNRLFLSVMLGSIFTIGDLVVIWFFKSPINDISLKTIELSYVLANVLGLFIANRLRQFRQKQYSTFLQEQTIRKELEKVAFVDHLTGALNRRKFFQLGTHEFNKCKSAKTSFAIMMLDLDFFKKLNDEFGHAAGDHYLKHFAETIITKTRNNDIFGRLGGEEFALLLPNTNLESALEMAERLRHLFENVELHFNNQLLRTTVSIGVAKLRIEERTFQDVLKRADDALYQAKRNGRNQVQCFLESNG